MAALLMEAVVIAVWRAVALLPVPFLAQK